MPKANPKRRTTKAKTGIKVIRTPSGVRYMRGGKFVSAAKAKAARKAKATRRKTVKANAAPKKVARKRRVKRNYSVTQAKANPSRRKRRVKRKTTGGKTMAKKIRRRRRTKSVKAKPRKRTTKSRSRKAAARKAAHTRALKKAKRSAAAKKAARTRKRRGTGGVKRRRRVSAKSRVRKTTRRRRVRHGSKVTHHNRRRPGLKFRARPAPGKRKRLYRVKRTTKTSRRGKRYYRYSAVRANPLSVLKKALPIYGGMLGVRVLTGLIKGFLAGPTGSKIPIPAQIAGFVPAGAAFLFSALIAPKIKPLSKLVPGMQLGASVLLLDQVVKAAVNMIPATTKTGVVGSVLNNLAGYDDMGAIGYGYAGYGGYAGLSEYAHDPSGYSLPAVRSMPISGYGAEASEAMALDEYVPETLGNYSVEEALSNNELTYMQNGGAGGSLKGSLFRS